MDPAAKKKLSIIGLIVAVAVAVGVSFAVRALLFGMPAAKPIADADWKVYEAPGRFRILLPGTPKKDVKLIDGKMTTILTVEVNTDDSFAVRYTDLPVDRRDREQGAPFVLGQANQRMLNALMVPGVKELSRGPLSYGGFPAEQFELDTPKSRGYIIGRTVYADPHFVSMLVGGVGYTSETPAVKKFLDSLEILKPIEKPAEPKK